MASIPYLHYALLSPDYFETFDTYKPEFKDFIEPARRLTPQDWEGARRGLWYNFKNPAQQLPQQGWKIHLSSVPGTANALLSSGVRTCVTLGASYKVLLDRTVFGFQNSKNATRESAGKFVTIYPTDKQHFFALLESLYQELVGFNGPYILSDRRYRDCQTLYYRYGGILPRGYIDNLGVNRQLISAPDGSQVQDERRPFFVVPPWEQDPFPDLEDASGEGSLKAGRYQIDRVLGFSAFGGVYLARDVLAGSRVVIKEARPHARPTAMEMDSVALLKKEHRLLRTLEDTRVAPRPIDFFRDWEHYFLVQEFIDGESLKIFENRRVPALRREVSRSELDQYLRDFVDLYSRIAAHLAILHDRGIVFGDVSNQNVIVVGNGEDVRLIDFEGAYEVGVDSPTAIFTPGFARTDQKGAQPSFRGDVHGLGALMIAAFMPINSLFSLDNTVIGRLLEQLGRDLALPPEYRDLVSSLLGQDEGQELTARSAAAAIRQLPVRHRISVDSRQTEPPSLDVAAIYRHILSTATYERTDRLFPADPRIFVTNPLSLAYGVSGVALSLHHGGGGVPAPVLNWILERDVERCPPGLYIGISGVAWVLAELGQVGKATELMLRANDQLGSCTSSDVFSGTAGVGLAQLKMFAVTNDVHFAEEAAKTGDSILKSLRHEDGESWWPGPAERFLGYAHGSAGVCLFLLYLHAVTGERRFLDAGITALESELRERRVNKSGSFTWPMHVSSPVEVPYWRYGSAGICEVLLRYYAVTGRTSFLEYLALAFEDVSRKYTIYPGRFFGMSGLGDCLLDLAAFSEQPSSALSAAEDVAKAVSLFAVQRPDGVAFPGETLFRLSCDFGTGSAGIALFLSRLKTAGQPVLKLDQLLEPIRSFSMPGEWTAQQNLTPVPHLVEDGRPQRDLTRYESEARQRILRRQALARAETVQ